jgi:hypothetical protein
LNAISKKFKTENRKRKEKQDRKKGEVAYLAAAQPSRPN